MKKKMRPASSNNKIFQLVSTKLCNSSIIPVTIIGQNRMPNSITAHYKAGNFFVSYDLDVGHKLEVYDRIEIKEIASDPQYDSDQYFDVVGEGEYHC